MADEQKAEALLGDEDAALLSGHLVETTTTEVTIVNSDGSVEVTSSTTATEYQAENADAKEKKDETVVATQIEITDTPVTEIIPTGTNSDQQDPKIHRTDSNASSSSGTKKKKPLSPSMQRLTAKKGTSPDLVKKGPSADERKAKADDNRKKKILEQRSKEDEKRAAVLERKKRLDDAERLKKDALFKKIANEAAAKTDKKQPMKKRYSASTSNLTQLKKSKTVECEIKIDGETTSSKDKVKPPERPRSSLQRPRPSSSTSSLTKVKDKKILDASKTTKTELKRPGTAEPRKILSRPPSSRLSLNPRPASALGVTSSERRKTLQTLPSKPKAPIKAATTKPAGQMSSTSSPAVKKTATTSTTRTVKTVKEKRPMSGETKPTTPKGSIVQKTVATKTTSKSTIPPKASALKSASTKSSATPPKVASEKNTTAKPLSATKTKKPTYSVPTDKLPKKQTPSKTKPGGKSSKEEKPAGKTEEEAKKALAERRKQAKEEAEAKAKAEREKDEVEKLKREEEEKRLAEELKVEEERQTQLLEQLKKEEEERRQKMMEEKEQREREEKERIEEEQRQREEEIDRKAKAELEKIQKEQEKKDLELDAERIERKKRVEMIMARVQAKKNGSTTDLSAKESTNDATSPTVTQNGNTSISEEDKHSDTADDTRLRVDGILRSRGLGRSTEDLINTSAYEKAPVVEISQNDSQTGTVEVPNAEIKVVQDDPSTSSSNVYESNKEDTIVSGGEIADLSLQADSSEKKIDNTPVQMEFQSNVESVNQEESCIQIEIQSNVESSPDEETLIDVPTEVLSLESAPSISLNDQDDNIAEIATPREIVDDSTKIEVDLSQQQNELIQINDSANQTPVQAWSEQPTELIETELKPEVVIPEDEKVDVDSESTVITEIKSCENFETNKFENSNNNLFIANGDSSLNIEDLSNTTEQEQWNNFEEKIKGLQPDVVTEESTEETKLWKVMEGKVELSECF